MALDQKIIGLIVDVDRQTTNGLSGNSANLVGYLGDNVILAAIFKGRDETGALVPYEFDAVGAPQSLRVQIRSIEDSTTGSLLYAFQYLFNQNVIPSFEDLATGQVTWLLNLFSTELQSRFAGDIESLNCFISITYKSAQGNEVTLLQAPFEIRNQMDDGASSSPPPDQPTFITTDEANSQLLRRENNGFWANVIDRDLTAAPGSPTAWDRYLVAAGATGLWAGQDDNIAVFNGNSSVWEFFAPKEGWEAYIVDESITLSYLSAAWGIAPLAAHATSHEDGGSDEINVADLSGKLADAQKSAVQLNGSPVGSPRPNLNFIDTPGIAFNITEDAGDDAIDIQATALSAGLNQDFDSSTTDSDPGSGNLRFSNGAPSFTTQVFCSDTDKDGLDVESEWDGMQTGDSIVYRQASDTSKFVRFDISGTTVSATNYSKLQVSHIQSAGTFDNGAELVIEVYKVSGSGDMTGTTPSSNNRIYVSSDGTGKNAKEPNADIDANNQKIDNVVDPTTAQQVSTKAYTDTKIASVSEDTTPQLGGILDANAKQIRESKGADVASAAVLAILTDGNHYTVTGTTTIVSITPMAIGTLITLDFAASLTITDNANIILPNNGSNIVTTAGDTGIFRQTGATEWTCLSYQKADGQALQVPSSSGEVETNSVLEYSSTTTAANPGAMTIRFDSVTMGSITEAYINDADRSTKDIGLSISLLSSGMAWQMGDIADSTGGAIFQVTGDPVDNGGWWTVPMVHVDDATTGLTNTEKYGIQIVGGAGSGGGGGGGSTAIVMAQIGDTQTASASADIQFLNLAADTNYEIKLDSVRPTTDSTHLFMEVSDDNGATWKTTGYEVEMTRTQSAAQSHESVTTGLKLSNNQGNAAAENGGFKVWFGDLGNTTGHKQFYGSGTYLQLTTDDIRVETGGFYTGNTAAINAVRFIYSSGTIAEGVFKLRGETTINESGASATVMGLVEPAKVASNDATIEFDTPGSGSYKLVFIDSVPITDMQPLQLQVYVGGAWQTSGYLSDRGWSNNNSVGGNRFTSSVRLSDGDGNDTGEGSSGFIEFGRMSETDNWKKFAGVVDATGSVNNYTQMIGGSYQGGTGAVTKIRVKYASGNISSGTFKLFGETEVGSGGGGSSSSVEAIASATNSLTVDVSTLTSADLRVVLDGRSSAASVEDVIYVRFNSDTGTNYDCQMNNINADASIGGTSVDGPALDKIRGSEIPAATALSNAAGMMDCYIPRFADTTFNKQMTWKGGYLSAAVPTTSTIKQSSGWAEWRNTNAITSITFLTGASNFVDGTRLIAYEV